MTHLFNKFIMMIFLVCTSTQIGLASDSNIFSGKEKAWLKDHPQIRLIINTRPPPISMWEDSTIVASRTSQASQPLQEGVTPTLSNDGNSLSLDTAPMDSNIPFAVAEEGKQGVFKGVAADYLLEVANITGITFTTTLVSDNNFEAISEALQKGEVDLMPTIMMGQPNISEFLLTDIYIRVPVVVVMNSDAPYLEDMSKLNSMKVAGTKSIEPKLDSLGLTVKVHYLSPREGLMGVASGRYDAFLSGLANVSHELVRTPVTNIKIVGELPSPSEFCMAIASQIQNFVPIFNKAIRAIPQERKDKIWGKWFRITYEEKYSSTVFVWGLGFSSIFAVIAGSAGFFFYRGRFSKIKNDLTALEPNLLCVHTDDNTNITAVTTAFCEVTGFGSDYLVGKPLSVLGIPVGASQSTLEKIFETVRKNESWQGEIKLNKKDGSELWADVVISPQRRKNEKGSGYTVVFHDATRRKHNETLAVRDELTGLYNKHHFNSMTPELLKKAFERKVFLGMFLLEVDNFNKYNDNYGNPAGDKVLAYIGDTLQDILQRDDDLCFRLGGEEFGVVTLFGDAEGATDIATKILTSISVLKIEHKDSPPGIITISIGIRVVTGSYRGDMETIYQQADKALYEAKESGGNRFVGFDGRTKL